MIPGVPKGGRGDRRAFFVAFVAITMVAAYLFYQSGSIGKSVPVIFFGSPRSFDETIDTSPELNQESIAIEIDGEAWQLSLPDGQLQVLKQEDVPSSVWTQSYQGLDQKVRQSGSEFLWFRRPVGDRIFGRMITSDGHDVLPLYICSIGDRMCEKAIGPAEELPIGEKAFLPEGAVSLSGQRVAAVIQHDMPYIETGEKWELFVYESDHLSNVPRTFDLSPVIDRSPAAGYDSISSVAWSPDEQQIAIATSRKIVIVNIQSGVLATVFETPIATDDEEGPVWDNSALAWSSGGRYIAFASYSEAAGADDENDEEIGDRLELIDLAEGNARQIVFQGDSIQILQAE